MSAHEVSTATAPVVLTADGRRELEARLGRAEDRLLRIAEELRADRDATLLDEQRQLRAMVEELGVALAHAVAPGEVSDDPEIIELGDEVQVRFPDGDTETLLIVHPLEAGLDERRTSCVSPLARAVLGHRPGDQVTVTSPGGVYRCTVVARRRGA